MGANIPPIPTVPVAYAVGESGLTRVFKEPMPKTEPNSVFVIMPFQSKEMDRVFASIKDECTILKLNVRRADDAVGSHFVIKEIWERIASAELIVCDLTHERPNTYYELGYAHALGNGGDNTLLIAKKGTTLHFDIMPLQIHHYSSHLKDLPAIIQRNLPEMLRISRDKKEKEISVSQTSPPNLLTAPVTALSTTNISSDRSPSAASTAQGDAIPTDTERK